MEAVILPNSELVGGSAGQLQLFDRHRVNLLAVSRTGRRIAHRIRSVKLKAGDVIVLQGNLTTMPETLGALALPAACGTRSPHWTQSKSSADRRIGSCDGARGV